MKVLVTGGNGFIGWHVVERLLNAGHVPVVFDRHWPFAIGELVSPADYFNGDVRDGAAVNEAICLTDGVIHLAGVLGTQETIQRPEIALETNIQGSLNVFVACQRHKKPCVYLTLGNYWMLNPYSISKHAAEKLALMYNKEYDTKIAVVRGMNVYGPRQTAGPVRKIIPSFVTRALAGEDIEIYGDGEQRMDMIYVEDVADILVRALTVDHGVYSSVMEAGTGTPHIVLWVAWKVIEACESSSQIRHIPMRPGEEPASTVVANPATLAPLRDARLRPLSEGLPPTVEWYKNN